MLSIVAENELAFRDSLIMSCISKKATKIILGEGVNVNICKSLVECIIRIVNGSDALIDPSCEYVSFKPGVIIGGTYDFFCPSNICVSYFVESVMILCLYSKKPISAIFHGPTTLNGSSIITTIRVALPLLVKIAKADMKINVDKHSLGHDGVVSIAYSSSELCSFSLNFSPLLCTSVKALCVNYGLSSQNSSRFIQKFRGLLEKLTSDIYVSQESQNEVEMKGFSVSIYCYSSEKIPILSHSSEIPQLTPIEEFAENNAKAIATKILKMRSLYSDEYLWMLLVLMSFNRDAISQVKLPVAAIKASLSAYEEYSGQLFNLKRDQDATIISCIGNGLKNINKGIN